MKKNIILIILLFLIVINAETLFEVKDASNNKVLDISTDGLRVMNLGDTLMVISAGEIKANLDNSKGLSRSFSVTTTSSVKGSETDLMRLTGDSTRFWISDTGSGFGVASNSNLKTVNTNVLEVTTSDARLREGTGGDEYMDFSPLNIFLGLNAGSSVGVGKYNVLIGNNAGNAMVGVDDPSYRGWSNTFMGDGAGRYATNSSHNTYIGKDSGAYSSDGGENTFIGTYSGQQNNGSCNTFVGNFSAGNSLGTGSYNTCMGYLSGGYTTTGSYNLMLGDRSGYNIRAGSNNVSLGYRAGYQNQSGNGNVMIGYEAGFSETGSSKLYIDNSNTTTPLIYGNFSTNALTVNGTLTATGNTTVGGLLNISSSTLDEAIDVDGAEALWYGDNPSSQKYFSWGYGALYNYFADRITIGSTNYNSTYMLYVNGSAYCTGSWSGSDKRFKKDITGIDGALDKVIGIKGVSYKWRQDEFPDKNFSDGRHYGVIAQDLEKVMPEAVTTDSEGYKAVAYNELIPVLVEAVKELKAENESLKKRLEAVEAVTKK